MSQATHSGGSAVHKLPIQEATNEDCLKLKKIIEAMKFCMMTTVDENGKMHSRPMGICGEMESCGGSLGNKCECVVSFFTYADSCKIDQMRTHGNQTNLAFSDPSNHTFVSITGTGKLTSDRTELEKRWTPAMKAWFPNGLEEPGLAMLKVTVDQCEYWDAHESLVTHAVSFVRSQITGHPADPADHKLLRMGGGTTNTTTSTSAGTTTTTTSKTRDEEKMQHGTKKAEEKMETQ